MGPPHCQAVKSCAAHRLAGRSLDRLLRHRVRALHIKLQPAACAAPAAAQRESPAARVMHRRHESGWQRCRQRPALSTSLTGMTIARGTPRREAAATGGASGESVARGRRGPTDHEERQVELRRAHKGKAAARTAAAATRQAAEVGRLLGRHRRVSPLLSGRGHLSNRAERR